MAIAAGVPIIPVCVSSYVKHIRLNRWNSGSIMIRALPAIATAGLSQADLPRLIETCRTQMQQCIAAMDQQLTAA
ncbi:1-acyl-sn-glycerol-3-phosphate acyltransferase [compost metagenome]